MMTTKEHDSAVQRLDVGLAEQDRLTESYYGAIDTSSELGVYAGLRVAGAEVAARKAEVGGTDPRYIHLSESHD